MSSLLDKRSELFKTISSFYSSTVKKTLKQKCSGNINQTNTLTIKCDGEVCTNCIALYYKDFYDIKPEDRDMYIIELIKKNHCKTLCTCKASNIKMNNVLILNKTCQIDDEDFDIVKISEDISTGLEKKYGQVFDKSNVTQVISDTRSSIISEIRQSINQSQSITLEGRGNLVNISMENISDITLKAISSTKSAQVLVTEIITKMMEDIRNNVNKNFIKTITQAFEPYKWYFFSLAILYVLILFLRVITWALTRDWFS